MSRHIFPFSPKIFQHLLHSINKSNFIPLNMMSKALAFAVFLLLQNSSFSAAQRQKRTSGFKRPVRHLDYFKNEEPVYGSGRSTSFFEIEYSTLFGTSDDVEKAAQALATAYNKLIVEFDDPFERRMGEVRVLSAESGRRLTKEELRELQANVPTFNLFVTLEADGSCGFQCPSDFSFSDQLTTGRRKLPGKGKGGSKGGIQEPEGPLTSPDEPSLNPGLPTEEEILNAYSDEIQSMHLDNIVDVVALDEVDEPSLGTKKTSKKSSKKGKGSKSASKYSESKGSKKGSSKGSKESKGSKKSCKGKGSTELEGEPIEFTSYFRSLYGLIENSNLGLEVAANALATAYNRVIEDFESDARMENVFLFDFDTGRRLSWEEVRELQGFNFNAILESSGFCTDCGGQYTLRDQLTRRYLKKGGKGKGKGGEACLRPGLPTREEVRLEYNVVLEEIELDNVKNVIDLEEIDRVSIDTE
jgi:hypothetical protein